MLHRLALLLAALTLAAPAALAGEEPPEAVRPGVAFDFDMRAGAGASYKMTGGLADWGVGIDTLLLFRITPQGVGHCIMPELGYSATLHADDVSDHYFVGGVGYGFHHKWFAAGIVPSLVAGRTENFTHQVDTGLGLRTTLFAEVPWIIGVQVHHQFVVFGGRVINEFCFSASLNMGLVVLFLKLNG